jgi:hypothetical protein
MMSAHDLERQYLQMIEEDLASVHHLQTDPLSTSVYLFFIARNKIQTTYIDNLIDWANTWVKAILSDGRLTKFVDRDITSALLDYYSLRQLNRLRVEVEPSGIESVLQKFFSHNRFFESITHTCLILISLINHKGEINSYESCLDEVIKAIKEPEILNDPKNMVFAALLLELNSELEQLRGLCSYALSAMENPDVQFSDKIYFTWLLWTYRDFIDKGHAARIRTFTAEVVEGLKWTLSQPITSEVDAVYGVDHGTKISKVQMSISLDLICAFNREPNMLEKVSPTILVAELKIPRTRSEAIAFRNSITFSKESMSLLVASEQKLREAESKLDVAPKDYIDTLGESMESICKAYCAAFKIGLRSPSGFDLHDTVVKHWKEKTKRDWTELKYQTGLRHILRIWALKKHETYETNVLEGAYLLLLAWRGYYEMIRLIDETSRSGL